MPDQTTLDLDQVRDHLDQWQARTALPPDAADRTAHTLAGHVPALLNALNTTRDEAAGLEDQLGDMRATVSATEAALDDAVTAARLAADRTTAHRRAAKHWRPIVAAAIAWRDCRSPRTDGATYHRASAALAAAVNAFTDASVPPARAPEPEPSLARRCAHPSCQRAYQADKGPAESGWTRLRGLTVLCPDHPLAPPAAAPAQAPRSKLGNRIIATGPYVCGQANPLVHATAAEGNELRDELAALRQAATGPLIVAARALVDACGRMLDHWAEADDDVRNRDLWQPLHQAADNLRELIESPPPAFAPATNPALTTPPQGDRPRRSDHAPQAPAEGPAPWRSRGNDPLTIQVTDAMAEGAAAGLAALRQEPAR